MLTRVARKRGSQLRRSGEQLLQRLLLPQRLRIDAGAKCRVDGHKQSGLHFGVTQQHSVQPGILEQLKPLRRLWDPGQHLANRLALPSRRDRCQRSGADRARSSGDVAIGWQRGGSVGDRGGEKPRAGELHRSLQRRWRRRRRRGRPHQQLDERPFHRRWLQRGPAQSD